MPPPIVHATDVLIMSADPAAEASTSFTCIVKGPTSSESLAGTESPVETAPQEADSAAVAGGSLVRELATTKTSIPTGGHPKVHPEVGGRRVAEALPNVK